MYGIIYLNQGRYDSALTHFQKARDIYFAIGNKLGIVNYYNNVALTYSDLGQYSDAIYNYTEALRAIEKFNDEKLATIITVNLGKLYIELNIAEEAEKFLKRGLALANKYNQTGHREYIYSMLGSIALRKNNFSLARQYYDSCLLESRNRNNLIMLASCHNNIGEILERQGEFGQAEEYYKTGLEIASGINLITGMVRSYNHLAYIYYKCSQMGKAKEFAQKAYELSSSTGFKEGLKNSSLYLGYINYAVGNYRNAYDYLMYSDTVLSDISDNKTVFTVSELLQKIEKDRNAFIAEISLQKKHIRNLILLTIVILLIAMIIAIVLIYKRKIRKSRLKENLLNRELTSKAIFLAKRNEVFSKIESTLLQNKDRFIPENQPLIQEVINDVQSAQDQQAWKEFEYYFNSVHKDFYTKLEARFPNLTLNERRLCALLRLNLTTKDISSITHQSAHSIDIARARLRKKLGLANVKVPLYNFLSSF
jgi:tetratricopeptide (TPR) repeat protein